MKKIDCGKQVVPFLFSLAFLFGWIHLVLANPITSDIDRVRLYADRAEVTWKVRAEVPRGASSLSLSQLPGVLVPGSIRLRQVQGKPVNLNNVKTDRVHGSEFSSKAITDQEQVVKELLSSVEAVEDEIDILHQQLQFIASLVNSGSGGKNKNEKPDKSGPLALHPESWDAVLKMVSGNGLKLRRDLRVKQDTAGLVKKKLEAAKRKLRELKAGARKLTYNVEIEINSSAAAKPVFEMTYQVRNTGWRPVYHLKADTRTKKISVEYYGEIYQRTGEDWDRVELELSTGVPVLGARIPKLPPWIVDYPKPRPPVDVMQSEPREKVMGMAMKQADDAMQEGAPVVDQGTAMLFKIPNRQNISSGATDHRARIARMNFDMALTYRSIPKLSPFVYLSAEIANHSQYHWLAGNGLVYVDGGFVGNSRIDSVAPDQKMDMGLGVDRGFRIERRLVKKEGALEGVFGKKNRLRYIFEIEIENFKKEPVVLEVVDQLPLPYQKDIRVIENKIEPAPGEDDKNRLTWEIALDPGEMKTIQMDYQVEYPEGKEVTGLN
ncbi:hypothetical protein UZ36_00290 [Candidatus Nitromaritima sp. SCGC AAA799-C22]|nr:hypothetical protein UZ36_00290 [Candidatus Nitromaritima sp. SCGC AAA799-C22]